jgi:hypothetical protein
MPRRGRVAHGLGGADERRRGRKAAVMNRTIRKLAAAAALVLAAAAAAAGEGLPPLAENPRVREEFLAAAVGDEIRSNCPTLSARMVYVLRRAKELERYVLSLGYTEADIRAVRKSREARAWLRAARDAYLEANGVVPGDAESYCRLGRQEIEKGSLIGALLR